MRRFLRRSGTPSVGVESLGMGKKEKKNWRIQEPNGVPENNKGTRKHAQKYMYKL